MAALAVALTLTATTALVVGIVAYSRHKDIATERIVLEHVAPPRTTWGVMALASQAPGAIKWIAVLTSIVLTWVAIVAYPVVASYM